MNKKKLKTFARNARKELINIVSNRLEYILTTNDPEIRNKKKQLKTLKNTLNKTSKDQLIEELAYIWFNRFIALCYMDANNFHPLKTKIVSPTNNSSDPQILAEAKQGLINDKLKIDKQEILNILMGNTASKDPQNEAYKKILIAVCNYYHYSMPFMFEKSNDYTELLMPQDLISAHSIRAKIVENLSEEDCQQVEIIGWLYQYYISEKKDKIINISSKKRYDKNEIPAATQLFTPDWIVKYMVDNTLGQIWMERHPDSNIEKHMDFYIQSDQKILQEDTSKSAESITLIDPACGSGHILVYAFELFTKIYEEEGYNPSEIPYLILKNNLFGIEIDERAGSLAAFSLVMKAQTYYNGFLENLQNPHIITLEPINIPYEQQEKYINAIDLNIFTSKLFKTFKKFDNVKIVGSLIKPEIGSVLNIREELEKKNLESDLFISKIHKEVLKGLKQIEYLQNKYDCAVTNPPYINSKHMNEILQKYVKDNYKISKKDLFACFILRNLNFVNNHGFVGFMSPFVWMFISSFEELRHRLINEHLINNLIQLEYSGFSGATVPICTFTLYKDKAKGFEGSYIKLSEFKGAKNQPIKTLKAINNPEIDYRFETNQNNFKQIPGSPIAYWASPKIISIFNNSSNLYEFGDAKQGLITGNNKKFLKYWFEVQFSGIGFNFPNRDIASNSLYKWYPYNKGGSFRKWYGNIEYIVNWYKDGKKIRNYRDENGKLKSRPQNMDYYFKRGITWSALSNKNISFRIAIEGSLFDAKGSSFFLDKDVLFDYLFGMLNSKPTMVFLEILAPTLDFNAGSISHIPAKIIDSKIDNIKKIVKRNISISKFDWDSRETAWGFTYSPLLKYSAIQNDFNSNRIETAIHRWEDFSREQFIRLHSNEEELNRIFIDIYGLEDEMDPIVSLKDITILQDELDRKKLVELDDQLIRDKETYEVLNYNEISLPFKREEVIRQFISYAVGCMFGRYSLDKESLILANQGDTLDDYLEEIPEPTFMPDDDNIIPILKDEWFPDDIVGRFKEFLKITFGEEHYEENLNFIEDTLDRSIRSYFAIKFYKDHCKRYNRRPIYWMFSSRRKKFNVLIYMHRYKPDTVSRILNDYIREFLTKLNSRYEHLESINTSESESKKERRRAKKEMNKIEKTRKIVKEYEGKVEKYANKRIDIDLDDGVKTNYAKFKGIIKKM